MKPFQALLMMNLAKFEWQLGRQAAAIREFEEGWSIAQESDDPTVKQYAVTFRIYFYFWQGRCRDLIGVYEDIKEPVARYPRSRFPIVATRFLGSSMALSGQVTEGLGMLYGLQEHCRDIGNLSYRRDVLMTISHVLLQIGRVDEMLRTLEAARNMPSENMHPVEGIAFQVYAAAALAFRGDQEKAERLLSDTAKVKLATFVSRVLSNSAMLVLPPLNLRTSVLATLSGHKVDQIVTAALKRRDVFVKAMAYALKGRLQIESNQRPKEIVRTLKQAAKWLKVSGHEISLAKIHLELVRAYMKTGNRGAAMSTSLEAHRVLAPINPALIPEDLTDFVKDTSLEENLLTRLMALGQEIVAIRDGRELVMHILSSIMQITGTERGGIFLSKDSSGRDIQLEATKNLTEEHVRHPSFAASMDVIRETITTGKGQIWKKGSLDLSGLYSSTPDALHSYLCVPIILKDEIIGALYHDNRLLESPLEEADLHVFSYLSGQLAIALDNARAYEEIRVLNRKLTDEKQYYVEADLQRSRFKNFIGESDAIRRVFDQVGRVAGQDTVVLIQGETGVGKELVARTIQAQSNRKDGPFIVADCSAFTESIITSELFGHEKGAFTGALSRKAGRFELAHGGTLFLDEIGNIPMETQVRLLRVLQAREFQRVGGIETIQTDFRLIAATNRDLEKEAAAGRFREDLYYRLNVFPIIVPPLRERRDDIPLLAMYFLKIYAAKAGRSFEGIPKSEMRKLLDYAWPGNVRELESIIERSVILSSGNRFRIPELSGRQEQTDADEQITLAENERRHILKVLEKTGGKVRGRNGAAEYLDMNYGTLYSRMKKLGIKTGGKRA